MILASGCALIDAGGESTKVSSQYTQSNIPGGGPSQRAVAIGEINGVSGPDVAAIDDFGNLVVCIAMGDTAEYTIMNTEFSGYTKVGTADLDADGEDEIIVAADGVIHAIRMVNSMVDLSAHAGPGMSRKITSGRFAASGSVSIVVLYEREVRVIHDPLGTPTSTSLQLGGPAPNFSQLLDVVAANIKTMDPSDELVIADGANSFLVEHSGPSFTMRQVQFSGGSGDGRAFSMAVGDFGVERGEPDGTQDIAFLVLGTGPGIGRVFYGQSNGLATSGTTFGDAIAGQDLTTGDYNGDGKADVALLALDDSPSTIKQYLQGGQGVLLEVRVPIDGRPDRMAAGDFNGDGRDDFLLSPGAGGGMDLLLSN